MSISEQSDVGLPKIGCWLKRISIVAILLLPLAVLGFRLHLYPFSIASKLLAVSLLLAALTFLSSIVVSIKQRYSAPQSSKQASIASYISLVPLLLLGSQIITATSLPMIHNISTDVVNPPQFDKVIALRGEVSNPHVYDIESLAQVQQQAYPEINTLIVGQSKQVAYEQSLKAAQSLGWDIVNKDPIKGIIEASQTSLLWGFTDDVVVRISQQNSQTAIDLRSVSRVGRSDLGQNAKRIKRFFKHYAQ